MRRLATVCCLAISMFSALLASADSHGTEQSYLGDGDAALICDSGTGIGIGGVCLRNEGAGTFTATINDGSTGASGAVAYRTAEERVFIMSFCGSATFSVPEEATRIDVHVRPRRAVTECGSTPTAGGSVTLQRVS